MLELKRIALVSLAVAALSGTGLVAGNAAWAKQDHKVTICHFTASETNPAVVITIDEHALKHHLDNHVPPVHQGSDFVITGEPPFSEADCVVPGEED